MAYVECFVAPVRTANRAAYEAMSKTMAAIHKDNGALEITECWGTNVPPGEVTSFPLAVQLKRDETVVMGWIKWPSKGVRDEAFQKMRGDSRMKEAMASGMPFDGKRMIFGGFEPIMEE